MPKLTRFRHPFRHKVGADGHGAIDPTEALSVPVLPTADGFVETTGLAKSVASSAAAHANAQGRSQRPIAVGTVVQVDGVPGIVVGYRKSILGRAHYGISFPGRPSVSMRLSKLTWAAVDMSCLGSPDLARSAAEVAGGMNTSASAVGVKDALAPLVALLDSWGATDLVDFSS
eukprot:SAG31_NODE_1216_length_9328_cov_12.252465_11_plen_172_part_01